MNFPSSPFIHNDSQYKSCTMHSWQIAKWIQLNALCLFWKFKYEYDPLKHNSFFQIGVDYYAVFMQFSINAVKVIMCICLGHNVHASGS